MKKLIIIMMMFLALIMSCFYVTAVSNTESDEWGNMMFYNTNVLGNRDFGGAQNASACYPFSVRENGYLEVIGLSIISTYAGEFNLWITEDNPSPYWRDYVSLHMNSTGIYQIKSQATPRWEKYLYKSQLYYLCVGTFSPAYSNEISHAYTNYLYYNHSSFNNSMVNMYETSLKDYILTDSLDIPLTQPRRAYLGYSELGGGHDAYTPATLMICTKPNVDADFDKCYGKYTKPTGLYFPVGLYGTSFTGQIFKYKQETGYADSITLYLYGYVGWNNNSVLKFNISNTDSNGNVYTVLDDINVSMVNFSMYAVNHNYTEFTITFNSPILLEEDDYYRFSVTATSDKLYSAGNRIPNQFKSNYETELGETLYGWMGEDTSYYQWTTTLPALTRDYMKDYVFNLHFTTDVESSDPTDTSGVCDTTCTTWDSPYMLKEDFDGSLDDCGWATSIDYCWNDSISLNTADNFYTAFKYMDLLEDSDNRYFTVKFDLLPEEIETGGGITISVYDFDYNRFLYVAIMENNTLAVRYEGGWLTAVTGLSNTTSKEYMFIFDFVDDTYDIWYDGALVSSDVTASIEFWNVESAYGFRVSSQLSEYTFENLEVYGSDDEGTPVVVEVGDDTEPLPDEEDKWCGCFKNTQPSCTADAGCDTGVCLVNGKCSSFDYSWCSDTARKVPMVNGNKCVVGCMSSCVLNESKDLIIGNFLLFLVLVVIVMGLAYLVYISRG